MNRFIAEIRELIRTARQAVVRSVDSIQVLTNFKIGRRIIEHEQKGKDRAGYGEGSLRELAKVLTDEFGKGFSLTNLKLMRKFYLTYRSEIGQTVSGFLPEQQKGQTVSDHLPQSEKRLSPPIFPGITEAISSRFCRSWSLRELKRHFCVHESPHPLDEIEAGEKCRGSKYPAPKVGAQATPKKGDGK